MAEWVVREDAGSWLVRCGRTSQTFATEDEALRFVQRQQGRGDKVVREESDGYRIPLKPRRRWRRA